MNTSEHCVEVTGLSPIATEKDVYEFFAFSGIVEHVEIIRYGEYASTAYVTFKDAHALETAVLLSGATIVDQRVCITRWGQNEDEVDFWNRPSWRIEEEGSSAYPTDGSRTLPTTGEAVIMAQDVVKTMLTQGFVLGRDALSQAKAFDESHGVSASAAAKLAEMSNRIGLTGKISAGVGAARSIDEMYGVTETTKSAISAAGRTAAAAASTVINSSYFSRGALYLSDALNKAAKTAADLGNHASNK